MVLGDSGVVAGGFRRPIAIAGPNCYWFLVHNAVYNAKMQKKFGGCEEKGTHKKNQKRKNRDPKRKTRRERERRPKL